MNKNFLNELLGMKTMCKSEKTVLFTPIFVLKCFCIFSFKSAVILLFSFMLYNTYNSYFPNENDFKKQFPKELLVGYESDLKVVSGLLESCGSRIGWLASEEINTLEKLGQWQKTIGDELMSNDFSRKFSKGMNCDGKMTKEYYSLFYQAVSTVGQLYIEGSHTLTVFLPEDKLLLSLYYEK